MRLWVLGTFLLAALAGLAVTLGWIKFTRIESFIFLAQTALAILLAAWIALSWRGRAAPTAARDRLSRGVHLALLAWLIFAARGCSADQMILGENHQTIDAHGARREVVTVDGRSVECWIARSGAPGPPQAMVLYFIGKGGRADQWVSAVAWSWKDRPVEVWAMNYPGSGGSTGPARLSQVAPDALAVYDAAHRANPSLPIFLQGGSFGTSVVIYVAAQRPVVGIVLHNPPPLRQLILGYYGWWNLWLLAGPLSAQVPPELDSLVNAPKCNVPAIFIMSGSDGVIPPRFQEQIWRAYAGPKHRVDVPTSGHSDALTREASDQLEHELTWIWGRKP
jgi:hypothetical protein